MNQGIAVETQSQIEDPFAEGLIQIDANKNRNHHYGSKSGRGQNTSNQRHQDQRVPPLQKVNPRNRAKDIY